MSMTYWKSAKAVSNARSLIKGFSPCSDLGKTLLITGIARQDGSYAALPRDTEGTFRWRAGSPSGMSRGLCGAAPSSAYARAERWQRRLCAEGDALGEGASNARQRFVGRLEFDGSLTRLESVASLTSESGQRRSWRSSFEKARGRLSSRICGSSYTFGERWTGFPARRS
jgi:hypothetical protein